MKIPVPLHVLYFKLFRESVAFYAKCDSTENRSGVRGKKLIAMGVYVFTTEMLERFFSNLQTITH